MKNPTPHKPDSFQDVVTIGHDEKCIPLTLSVIAAGDAAANLVMPILKDDPHTLINYLTKRLTSIGLNSC